MMQQHKMEAKARKNPILTIAKIGIPPMGYKANPPLLESNTTKRRQIWSNIAVITNRCSSRKGNNNNNNNNNVTTIACLHCLQGA